MGKIVGKLRLVLVLLFVSWGLKGIAVPLAVDTMDVPRFLNNDTNRIVFNGADWSPLFAEMVALQYPDSLSSQILSIVHIGDSHLQAGFFTDAVRRPLQRSFGNAGRGLVVPLKIAKTNEPKDYSIISSGRWNFSRCVGRKYNAYTPGIGGIAVVPTTKDIDLRVSTLSKTDDCAGFCSMRLFHAPVDSFPGAIDEPFVVRGSSCAPFLTQFSWDEPVCSVHLLGKINGSTAPLAIYGASLETGDAGILYHTIANNVAFFSSYAAIPRFAEQVAALSPRLIVVSLGTNESFSTSLTREALYRQIDEVVSPLRQENPQALVLLTTPAECSRRRVRRVKGRRRVSYLPNSRVEMVCETIRSYAREHELAYWDWYEVAGGKGSSEDWCKAGYMAYDRTHCTESGYRVQGEMLYRTLMNAYQEYVDGVAQ